MSSHESSRSSRSPSPGGATRTVIPPFGMHAGSPDLTSSPHASSPLNPRSHSQSPASTPPSRSSLLPTPPAAAPRLRVHSFTALDPSPGRESVGPIPLSRVTSAPAPLRSAGSSASLSTIFFAVPTNTASSFRSRSVSRSRSRDEEGAATPASTWWSHHIHPPRPWAEHAKRKRTVPVEQAEGYIHTRSRAIEAIGGVLGNAARVGHETLFVGVDLLRFAPVPGLELAGRILLNIWDAVELVEMNRLASLRLTERCADILISVREEIAEAGDSVSEELHSPIAKLNEAFEEVLYFLRKLGHRPFLKRYLKREEILRNITFCDAALSDALGMFGLSIQIRTLKLVQANELRRQKETADILDTLMHLPGLPPVSPPVSTTAPASPPTDSESVRRILHALRTSQNAQDRAHDLADLRQVMRAALSTNDDVAMVEVLQIARSELPEAIKTLQRALEREVEREESEADESAVPISPPPVQFRIRGRPSTDSGSDKSGSRQSTDTLDREFIETGIDALRRLSQGAELGLPSWTITRYEVDLETKIGLGFFSDVYRGTWREHTVAIKVLAETTPRNIFVHEVEIWKKLYHPNVLELLGASSASGDPPWFLVSKYYPRGSLVKYLKNLSDAEMSRIDVLRMIHEIAKGMAYLHKEGVLHGDLKSANVLVDDDARCVISDFGQSELKSEVYRISRAPVPRTFYGTLRWQAPELMQGANVLTPEMDVYAFAISCVEVLTKGALPWPLMDDDAVRRFVLNENMRPSLPPSNLSNSPLMAVIRASWDRAPANRPSFEQIARDIKKLRAERGAQGLSSPTVESPRPSPILSQWAAQNPHHTRPSPDILPGPLPGHTTAESGQPGSALQLDTGEEEVGSLSSSIEEPVRASRATHTLRHSHSTNTVTPDASVLEQSILASGYLSPPEPDDTVAKHRDERRYRMLLQHEFHTILTLPLWRPSHVELGAVGYLSKPDGRFETLFNAFNPGETSGGKADELPMLSGYGKVFQGSQRQDKRNAAQRGLDRVQGLFSSAQTVSRTQSFQLRAGHKVAYIYAETTMYRYITNLDVPKKWFQSNIDHIMKIYSKERRLTREDIYLVIGTLDAPDYASFVSHSHPDGQVNFNVFMPMRVGQPWGSFTLTSAEQAMQPSSGTVHQEMVGAVTSSNVSTVKGSSGPWDSVLLARLRFKPDLPEPTSL
ncbi:hypothetical protein BC834DRAFT_922465 [Gloeopeniophorella convolvens]|nr:hypothetical protein BC834DRAFT_922465 [Gloeopeniophorella convolvens]